MQDIKVDKIDYKIIIRWLFFIPCGFLAYGLTKLLLKLFIWVGNSYFGDNIYGILPLFQEGICFFSQIYFSAKIAPKYNFIISVILSTIWITLISALFTYRIFNIGIDITKDYSLIWEFLLITIGCISATSTIYKEFSEN